MANARPTCRHQDAAGTTLTIVSRDFRWRTGERVDPPVRGVKCTLCGKRWVIDLNEDQRSRVLRLRGEGDRRSPYEMTEAFHVS